MGCTGSKALEEPTVLPAEESMSAPSSAGFLPQAADSFDSIGPQSPKEQKQVRLLLLGPGESGKSTFFKQLKIIQEGNFSQVEREGFRPAVHGNVLSQMRLLVEHHGREEMDYSSDDGKEAANQLLLIDHAALWTEVHGRLIKALWAQESIRLIYNERERLFTINDSASYFFDNIDRINSPSYVPTEADLLRVRIRSVAFEQAVYIYRGTAIKVWDVGGQIPERKKWKKHLRAATGLIYFASLSEYDQRLREDSSIWRIHDTLELFREICMAEGTDRKPLVLMLNKMDLFKEKIQIKPLTIVFPDYKGKLGDWSDAADFVKRKFFEQTVKSDRDVFWHYCCAVDSVTMAQIWESVRDILILKAFDKAVNNII